MERIEESAKSPIYLYYIITHFFTIDAIWQPWHRIKLARVALPPAAKAK
jgi:hypothetical protein